MESQKDKTQDRRSSRRFPFHWNLRYNIFLNGRLLGSGWGRTVNMGSGGVLFEADKAYNPGLPIQVCIDWPVNLDGSVGLQLQVSGTIARADRHLIAVAATRHEYRTRKNTLMAVGGRSGAA